MSELGIYVFSGTGNTLKCARALKEALDERGADAGFHEIQDGSEQAAERDLVICYPVHGFNAPNCMIRFCRGIPEGEGSVWFLKTSGEPLRLNDYSSAELARILRRKGYAVRGEFHYIMPYNMVFRHSDEMASLMWATARRRIPDAAKQISEGTGSGIHSPVSARVMARLCRIEHWFYPKNGRLFRVDADRCRHCLRCVNTCPTKNIRYRDGRFSFGGQCIGCVRCSFECPSQAIHIGLLDFMRVSGPYDFSRDPDGAVIGKYCKKDYERYFGQSSPTR